MKKSLKKGGIGDIVTLVIIIGLAMALLVAVVIPMVNKSRNTSETTETNFQDINDEVTNMSRVTFI